MLFAWHNVPTRVPPWLLAKISLQAVWVGNGARRPPLFVRALLAVSALCLSGQVWRRAVSLAAYRLDRCLQKNDSMRFEDGAWWVPRR